MLKVTLANVSAVAEAGAKWVTSGCPTVDPDTYLARSVECSLCPRWDARAGRCLECGCYALKLRLATESCPLGRWPAA